jgi:hypothetical protein
MGEGPTHACQGLFKKLGIMPIPCVYLVSLMTFVVNNLDKFQTNNSVHMINTRRNEHCHIPKHTYYLTREVCTIQVSSYLTPY